MSMFDSLANPPRSRPGMIDKDPTRGTYPWAMAIKDRMLAHQHVDAHDKDLAQQIIRETRAKHRAGPSAITQDANPPSVAETANEEPAASAAAPAPSPAASTPWPFPNKPPADQTGASAQEPEAPSFDLTKYAGRLRWAMLQREISGKALAVHLDVTTSAIYMVTNGHTKGFGRVNNEKAAAVLGVSCSWLMTGEGEPFIKPAFGPAPATPPAPALDIPTFTAKRQAAKLHVMRDSTLRDIPATLRNIAADIEAGKFGTAQGCVVVLDADRLDVFYTGTGETAPNAHLLLHAGAAKMLAAVVEAKA